MKLGGARGVIVCIGAAAFVADLGGIARAGSGAFIPPMRIDIGRVESRAGGEIHAGTELMIGLHLATIYPRPLPVDVGVGFINVADDPVDAAAPAPVASAAATLPAAAPAGEAAPAPVSESGWFVEIAGRLAGGSHWRTWLSTRGERLAIGARPGYGAAVRVTAEVWTGLFDGERGLGVVGVLSLGAWAELGVRDRPDGGSARAAATGLSLRVPLVIAD